MTIEEIQSMDLEQLFERIRIIEHERDCNQFGFNLAKEKLEAMKDERETLRKMVDLLIKENANREQDRSY